MLMVTDQIELQDRFYMRKALDLAEKARGLTYPNPLVGCVIVKNNKIIGQGYHKKAGKDHAEIDALKDASFDVQGATVYVNLEPCYHHGRTPPCVDSLIKAKVARVVIATVDPNPKVKGKSIDKLKAAGIDVRVDVLKKDALKLNEVFFMNIKKKRPFIVAKWAQTLDGAIADKDGDSKWITSSEARKRARTLRSHCHAVCVGINTILADNPRLNGIKKKIVKVVIDPNLKILDNFENLNILNSYEHIYIVHDAKNRDAQVGFANVTFIALERKQKIFDMGKLSKELYKHGLCSLFVEGGGLTLGSFFDAKLIDKVYVFTAPKIFGNRDARRPVMGTQYPSFSDIVKLKDYRHRLVGESYMSEGYPVYRR